MRHTHSLRRVFALLFPLLEIPPPPPPRSSRTDPPHHALQPRRLLPREVAWCSGGHVIPVEFHHHGHHSDTVSLTRLPTCFCAQGWAVSVLFILYQCPAQRRLRKHRPGGSLRAAGEWGASVLCAVEVHPAGEAGGRRREWASTAQRRGLGSHRPASRTSLPGEPLYTLHENYGLVSQQRKHDLNVGFGVQSQVLSFSF